MDNWIKRDLRYNWHPYTQMKDCLSLPPILIERAKGLRLYDARGNFYYDTISSWWCNVHGHNHPAINAAIKAQLSCLEHVPFAGFTHRPAILLAEKLVSLAPAGLNKVFFSDNGSTAVEVALKMSFQYWQNTGRPRKQRFVCLDRGYHGDTLGAMSVSGIDLFNRKFLPLLFSAYKAPAPYCYRCPMGRKRPGCRLACIRPLERLLEKSRAEIAGIILEPMVMAAAGMLVYPEEYLRQVMRLAKGCNVHLILDEVATGFGRTGAMFACEHAGVSPDFLCLSKGITSGYLPLAATLTTDKVYRAFYANFKRGKTFYHGHTYTANPLSCAAALASLKVFARENTLRRCATLAKIFRQGLAEFRGLPLAGDIRQIGLIGAIELVRNKKTKAAFPAQRRIGLAVYKMGLQKGLVLRPLGNIIYLFLPLCVKREELKYILQNTYSIIKSLRRR